MERNETINRLKCFEYRVEYLFDILLKQNQREAKNALGVAACLEIQAV